MDDDNIVAGCKELRDAIAAALGRTGDADRDGLIWEYRQEQGQPGTRVEFYELTEKAAGELTPEGNDA